VNTLLKKVTILIVVSESMRGHGVRPVKVLLPVDLAERIERALASGLGGFRDRHSLVTAAIDAYLLDLLYANEGEHSAPAIDLPCEIVRAKPGRAQPTVARVPRGITAVDTASALIEEPLLGLHNRDWPSLWALSVLAEMTAEILVPWHSFLPQVTSRAWKVAERIESISGTAGRKATALLPTNRAKAQGAESAFQSFAIAYVNRRPTAEGKFTVSGPLPLWRALAFTTTDSELCVGVSDRGWDLLEKVADLTPTAPHSRDAAEAFFRFLTTNSSVDWWGFQTMLAAVSGSPTRQQYIAEFISAREWSPSVAASTAQGYLARGREWGLVQPKIVDGRYLLTEFGKELSHA
jgi:hypothetical protein